MVAGYGHASSLLHQLGEVVEEIRIAGAAGSDTVTPAPRTKTQSSITFIYLNDFRLLSLRLLSTLTILTKKNIYFLYIHHDI